MKLYKETEFPLARVLYKMESEGFKVDTEKLAEFSSVLGEAERQLAEQV